jgi:zinc protease
MLNKTYPGPESIHCYILDNGITVLVYENFAAESVVIDGLVRAGALGEPVEKSGLASFTAEMLMRGTEKRSFDDIYEAIESIGADLDFSSGRHVTEFSTRSLAEDLDLMLDLLAESLRRPTFPTEQIEPVQGETMASLHIRANDTRYRAGRAFREMLYPDHPYGRGIDGTLETVAAMTAEDMTDFHRRYYGPEGMIITLVGAVKHEDALEKVKAAFGDWQPAHEQLPPLPDVERPAETLRTHVDMPEKTQSDIILGLPGPLRSAPDYLEASMANTVLGVFGMMGRLGQNVRESQGLAYYVYSRLQGGLGAAPWFVSTGVSPDKVQQAIDSILVEVDRIINEPIPEEELADSQAYRTGTLPVSLETNDGLATIISDIELYDLGLDYLQKLPDKINAMTPETVQAAAKKYLSTEQIAVAVAGPMKKE